MATIYTNKMLDTIAMAMSPKVNLLVFEGTIRSSKTVTSITAFYEAVLDSTERLHLIAAADFDAIRDNILYSDNGLITLFGNNCNLEKSKIGGYYVALKCHLPGRPKKKKILLAGYSDIRKWKKILGKTIGVMLIDEVNIANKTFVDECFARQSSADRPLQIWTLNGDVPTLDIYTDYINTCKICGKVPASIRADMERVPTIKGRYYIHWTMQDNPIMTPEKIDRASKLYPVGSYYYKIKILGERGSPGKMIYLDYMSDSLLVNSNELNFTRFTIGVDIAETRAKNVFALIGWNDLYSKCCVFDVDVFGGLGYNQKQTRLEAFIRRHMYNKYIECVAIDSAEQNFIIDMKSYFAKNLNMTIIPSNKATIKERIDMNIVAMSGGRFMFDKTNGKVAYDAFLAAKWVKGKEGEEREDLNQMLNDIMDAVEYGETVHMKAFMRAKIREA